MHPHTTFTAVAGLLLTTLPLFSACQKSPDQQLRDARPLVASGEDPDRAQQLLTTVLDEQPDNFDAKLLLAESLRLQDNFAEAETKLNDAAAQADIQPGQQTDLNEQQRSRKHLLVDHYTELHVAWAQSLADSNATDTFVDVLRRGLRWDAGHVKLNRMLVEHYWNKGQRLEEQGDRIAAADAYEQILDLQIPSDSDRPDEARARASQLRLEAFKQQGRNAWQQGARTQLAEVDGITIKGDSPEETAITLEVEQAFGSRIDTDDNKEVERARAAVKAKLPVLLRKLVLAVSDLPDDADLNVIPDNRAADMMLAAAMPNQDDSKDAADAETDDPGGTSDGDGSNDDAAEEGVDISYRTITLRTRMSLDEILEMAYDIQTAYRQATDTNPTDNPSGDSTTDPSTDERD